MSSNVHTQLSLTLERDIQIWARDQEFNQGGLCRTVETRAQRSRSLRISYSHPAILATRLSLPLLQRACLTTDPAREVPLQPTSFSFQNGPVAEQEQEQCVAARLGSYS